MRSWVVINVCLVFLAVTAHATYQGSPVKLLNGGTQTSASTASAAFNALSPVTTTGDLIYSSSGTTNVRLPIGTTNQVLTVVGGIPTWSASSSSAADASNQQTGLGLSASVTSNKLIVSVKQKDGSTDPTGGTPVSLGFRGTTLANGDYSIVNIASALSITVASGGTLGQTSAINQYVWVYALNDAGTVDICVSGVKVFFDQTLNSSTQVSAGSTSGTTLYCALSHTGAKPTRIIGRLLVNEATAGTWASVPSEIGLSPIPIPTVNDTSSTLTFTFTGLGTVSNNSIWATRNGDRLIARGSVQAGTTTATAAYIGLPSGLVIDTTKVPSTANTAQFGKYINLGAGSPNGVFTLNVGCALYYNGSNTDRLMVGCSANSNAYQTINGNSLQTSNTYFSIDLDVPIAGWSIYGP